GRSGGYDKGHGLGTASLDLIDPDGPLLFESKTADAGRLADGQGEDLEALRSLVDGVAQLAPAEPGHGLVGPVVVEDPPISIQDDRCIHTAFDQLKDRSRN